MKCSVLVLLLGVSSAYAASLYAAGNANGVQVDGSANPNGASANLVGPVGGASVQTKIKHFNGTLYLFAPQSWIDTFNAIPQAGQECLLTTFSDPANAAVAHSSDIEQSKQLVASKCPNDAATINAFFEATDATVKSLPAAFTNELQAYGEQMKQFGEQIKSQMAQRQAAGAAQAGQAAQGAAAFGQANGQGGSDAFRSVMNDYKQASIAFVQKFAALGQADRQQIATAFPKLAPFLTGPNAENFLKELQEMLTALSASNGQPDLSALRTAGQEFKTALQAVWNDYKTANADGLREAGANFGTDLSNAFQPGAFGQAGGFGTPNGAGAGNAMNNFREKFAEKRDEIKQRVASAWNQAKENGQEKFDQFKQAAAARGFNVGSHEKNSASVDVETH